MKRLLLLACLLPSCTALEQSPRHAEPERYHYAPIPAEEEARLRAALRDYSSLELTREWYSAVGADDVVRRCIIYRNAELDTRLAPFSSAPRWYREQQNEGRIILTYWGEVTTIRFFDSGRRELYRHSSVSPLCHRAEDGSAVELIYGTLKPLLPEHPHGK